MVKTMEAYGPKTDKSPCALECPGMTSDAYQALLGNKKKPVVGKCGSSRCDRSHQLCPQRKIKFDDGTVYRGAKDATCTSRSSSDKV